MMDLRGLEKFTLVDYPGKIACIVFTGGCNFRCPFCHNPSLVFDPGSQPRVTETGFFHFLDRRQGLLEGVVISGGEPTLQLDLPEFVHRIHSLGFLVKIDTNGSYPDRIKTLLDSGHVAAMGIDYKAPAAKYARLSGNDDPSLPQRVQESIRLALAAGVELDVRTTVHRTLLSPEDLITMRRELDSIGVKEWTLQQFHPVEVIDDTLLLQESYSDQELSSIAAPLPHTHTRGLLSFHEKRK